LTNLNQFFSHQETSQIGGSIQCHKGLVALFKRAKSINWQCRFKLPNGQWYAISTECSELEQAKLASIRIYERTMAKIEFGMALKLKKFKGLAEEELVELTKDLQSGIGKRVYRDYQFAINKYLIPFFGKYVLIEINQGLIEGFESWRISEMGRIPKASTKRTHASAYNRVIERARAQGILAPDYKIPLLDSKGDKGQARPAFTAQEIELIRQYMPQWVKDGFNERINQMRKLSSFYMEFLINTGVRHGTEAMPLRWRHIQWHWIGDKRYIKVWVSGKTGPRYLIAKNVLINVLEDLIVWQRLPYENLEMVIESKPDRLIFVLPSGLQPRSLERTFYNLMRDSRLGKDAAGRQRTMYSLRHTYATLALAEGIDIHTLARQMGTSILMIERHYSKMTPMMSAEQLAGHAARPNPATTSPE
jgi:integrase